MTVHPQSTLDRLVSLERQNARLLEELAALRAAIAAPGAAGGRRMASATTRRGLLQSAAAVAAGATAALVAGAGRRERAEADNGQALTLGQENSATTRTALAVTQSLTTDGYGFGVIDKHLDSFPSGAAIAGHTAGSYRNAVLGYAVKGHGVSGISDSPWDASSEDGYGVYGSGSNAGLHGESIYGRGVQGISARGAGVYGFANGSAPGVWGESLSGPGVHGKSFSGSDGVLGESESDEGVAAAVHAIHSGLGFALLAENTNKDSGYHVIEATTAGDGIVIHAAANTGIAVQAQAKSGGGVEGSSEGDGIGVAGTSNTGTGVYARSSTGESLRAEVLAGDSTAAAIHARHSGRGKAVFAEVTNPLAGATAVSAKTQGTGAAVIGKSVQGHGGIFGGKQAPLRLLPRGRTHPRAGSLGDLYVDTAGRLWFCTKTGNPATWRQLA